MEDTPSIVDRVVVSVEETDPERARAALADLETAPADDRKATVRALRSLADERPAHFEDLLPSLAPFLTDEERSVRLSTAKLFVAVVESEPGAAVSTVSSLADRLADEDEFYFVRARSAEALGYVALDHPDAVASPEVLADLRIGLAFDEPEVREKLAKALAFVALGDPDRLRHLVARLADHLDDENDLVRYYLCTALVAVGSTHPETLTDASAELTARLDDENPYVQGRAAEALGLVDGANPDGSLPTDRLSTLAESEETFAAERAAFATSDTEYGGTDPGETTAAETFGTVDSVRETTETAVEAMRTDPDGECPHCGLERPGDGPPMCPRCGAPW